MNTISQRKIKIRPNHNNQQLKSKDSSKQSSPQRTLDKTDSDEKLKVMNEANSQENLGKLFDLKSKKSTSNRQH